MELYCPTCQQLKHEGDWWEIVYYPFATHRDQDKVVRHCKQCGVIISQEYVYDKENNTTTEY